MWCDTLRETLYLEAYSSNTSVSLNVKTNSYKNCSRRKT